MDPRGIDRCVASGRWKRVNRATYVISGAPATWEQRLTAATLSVPGSVASHRSAAALWRCPGFRRSGLELTAPRRVDREGVKVHRTKALGRHEIRRIDGIPMTDPERTVIDVAAVADDELVEAALDHFLSKRLTTIERFERRLSELNGHGWRGTKLVRRLISERNTRDGCAESRLETKLFRTLRAARIRLPSRQVLVYDRKRFIGRVDVAYPDLRLIIEAQS